jgi:hypothetical protein
MSRLSESLSPGPYGALPGFKEPSTSRDAALAMRGEAANLRVLVLAAISAAGPEGLSPDEVAAKLNRSVLACRPRLTELGPRHLDKIEKTGKRRTNLSGMGAAVWREKL